MWRCLSRPCSSSALHRTASVRHLLRRGAASVPLNPRRAEMKMFWSLLNGQLEPGRSWAFWVPFAVLLFGSLILPTLLSRYALLNVNSFLLMAPLAAGLALLWGYGGVLSLGQSAFFGIGGYAYGIVAINLASTRWASLAGLGAGLVSAMSFAAALSWIVFYGRLRGVYVSIVTLVVTLVIETF